MWLSTEDARSDFILAAAALVFGTMVAGFVQRLPFYPGGTIGLLLVVVWIWALMVVPARFLASYREQGLEAFGLGTDRSGLTDGVLLVMPILAAGYVRGFSGGSVLGSLLGRLRGVLADPGIVKTNLLDLSFNLALLLVATAGAVLLFGLIVVRARDAFRQVDMPLLEALRTYGLGAVAVGTVIGLLLSVAGQTEWWVPLVDGGALAATILVADRMVVTSDRTSRATIIAPLSVTVAAYVFAAGGLFGSNLAYSLYRGAMAGAVAVILATVIETKRSAWAAVPLVAATMWAPTCGVLPVALLVAANAPTC